MSDIDEPERKVQMEEFHFQRRILFGCTVGLFFGIILWIIAMSTNRWFIVSGEHPIYVESHKRFFKSSYSGIWKNCRYAFRFEPSALFVVRNFTSLMYTEKELLKKTRAKIVDEEFFKNFPSLDLPDLDSIDEVDEALRQHMFAEWMKVDSQKFVELKTKFNKLYKEDANVKSVIELDPSKLDQVKNAVGELVYDVQFNKTHKMHVIYPNKFIHALFDGWNNQSSEFVKLLSNYANSLEISPIIYYGKSRFVFKPPMPPKKINKESNGFKYYNWHRCTYHNLFADEAAIAADPAIDDDIIDLSRTAATFAIITIFVMVLGFIFTVYTFLNPRYMFKRLAGGVHFIAGFASATVCRALHASVEHAREYLFYAFPDTADYFYGYGFFFGCIVTAINFISCIMFFWYSRKRKGDRAATEELGMADEAIQIGR